MTGQLESTPLGVFRLEADVQSYHTCSSRLILNASEKELHSTNDHSKRVALADDIPQRLQNRSSFRRKAEEISTLLPLHFNTDRVSSIFHLHHGSIALLTKDKFPLVFLVSLTELMTLT